MKNSIYALVLISLSGVMLLSGCGPSKKLVESRAKVDKLKQDSVKTQNQLSECYQQVTGLKSDKENLQSKYAILQGDLKVLNTESSMTIADQAKRLQTLQNLIQSQRDVMNALKNSMADALMNYSTDELSVYILDGNVYVSMQEKLLFKSGSDVVDPKGVEVLKKLSKVLGNTKDISVMIVGHTDNVPIKTRQFKDNWDLSTARATSIVRILTQDNTFDKTRITASGKSEFHPVKSNESAEGRAGNRRTDVILSPDLKELFKILEQ